MPKQSTKDVKRSRTSSARSSKTSSAPKKAAKPAVKKTKPVMYEIDWRELAKSRLRSITELTDHKETHGAHNALFAAVLLWALLMTVVAVVR